MHSFLLFLQSVGPDNLFVNYLSRIHREEVIESDSCWDTYDLPCEKPPV